MYYFSTTLKILLVKIKKSSFVYSFGYNVFFIFLSTVILITTNTSCRKENRNDCITGTGKDITVTRPLPFDFTKLIIDRKVDVILVQDSTNFATITAGENIIDNIVTQQKENNTLRIANDNKCNWVRSFQNKFTVTLHYKKLQQIYYTGSGNVTCQNTIITDSLRIDSYSGAGAMHIKIKSSSAWWNFHTGTANVKLEGDVGVSYVYDAAVGPVDGRDLKTGYTFCTNKGDNDLYVNVEKELGALVTYTGNVYYTGNPYVVITTTLHTGKVIEF
jgi:hypothetical protein